MHPAFSVIFFTTSSGAGYGLLALVGIGYSINLFPSDKFFALSATIIAILFITIGLISSTFHLGRPERAWRALSQWRSSWLSREGVLALLTYLPAIIFSASWMTDLPSLTIQRTSGFITGLLCIITVYTTSMIYASLKPIHAWNNSWVPLAYLSLSLMSGTALLITLLFWFEYENNIFVIFLIITILLGATIKYLYWHYIHHTKPDSNTASATGLVKAVKISLTQSPHSQDNYLLNEMGYKIARKHANKLRSFSIALAFLIPLILTLLLFVVPRDYSNFIVTVLTLIMLSGVLLERWLFFAEAKHTVTLYYEEPDT